MEVTWQDSQGSATSWTYTEDFQEWAKRKVPTIRTVGYLARETKDAVVLVQSVGNGQLLHGVKIPKCCVVKARRIR